LNFLAKLEKLEILSAGFNSNIKDASISELYKCKNLERLFIGNTDVSIDSTTNLASCKNLHDLSLCGCINVTDKKILTLLNSEKLQFINLRNSGVSQTYINLLKNGKNIKIIW